MRELGRHVGTGVGKFEVLGLDVALDARVRSHKREARVFGCEEKRLGRAMKQKFRDGVRALDRVEKCDSVGACKGYSRVCKCVCASTVRCSPAQQRAVRAIIALHNDNAA